MAYTAFITRIKNLRPHPNADRLQMGECFGNTVIVSLDYVDNQLGVYFPSDGQVSTEFAEANNLLRKKDENGHNIGGYMDPDKRNITAIKLRGEKSDGLFLPITCLAAFGPVSDLNVGDTIDIFNGVEICKKYIPKRQYSNKPHQVARRAKANLAPTFYEHVDTAQLAYNLGQFKTGDVVELTLKMHGTSGRTGYLPLVKHKQSWLDKLLKKPGKEYREYGYVIGTRRVVLDGIRDGGYYDDNSFRHAMSKKFEGKLHKGETVYYEIVGFVNENTPIMASVKNSKIKDKAFSKQYGEETVFSYGCDPNGEWEEKTYSATKYSPEYGLEPETETIAPKCEVYVYRMTQVNEDGDVVELSPDQVRYRCEQMGVKTVPVFERFIIPETEIESMDVSFTTRIVVNPGEYVLRKVEEYFDGPDPIGKTHIREGVVARIVNRPNIAVYKHKSFNFKVLEGIIKDEAAEPDMEEAQEVQE